MSLIRLKDKIDTPTWSKNILILGCGPSLKDFSEEEISKISKLSRNKTVIAIKQAIFHYPFSDILCINTCNLSDYSKALSCDDWDTHSIFQIAYPEMPYYDITKYDTILPIIGVNDFKNSLTVKKDLEEWSFNKRKDRKWGPGIWAETVFPLCEYLGAKNIYTIGWDLGTDNSGRDHFYKNQYSIYNKAQPLEPEETAREVELSRLFYEWFKSKNINLYIASENSHAHSNIPRVKL